MPDHKTMTKEKSSTKELEKPQLTAKQFITALTKLKSVKELDKVEKFFKGDDGLTKAFGVSFGDVFKTAKTFSRMPIDEIEKLLDSDFYEVRMGAVSIMDFQAREKTISEKHKKELYDLYMNRHDRINNWDLVDRSAPWVVGGYLSDKSRKQLYKLAKSKNPWERRTAIVATYFFIRQKDAADTFAVAELLVHDEHDLVNKAVGSWIREAGKTDEERLIAFLDNYAGTMPRVTLRYAVEKLDKKRRDYYLGLSLKK